MFTKNSRKGHCYIANCKAFFASFCGLCPVAGSTQVDGNPDTFDIELFDGNTGTKVNTARGVTIKASRWFQMGSILGQYAPSTTQGYAHIIRTSGSNPFIAYAVINDGARPQERSGDGAFIASAP
jgi:hypothetical protein